MLTPFKHCLDYFHDIENRWKFLTTGVHYCQRGGTVQNKLWIPTEREQLVKILILLFWYFPQR